MPSLPAGLAGLSLLATLYSEISQPPRRVPVVDGPDGAWAVSVLSEPAARGPDGKWTDRLDFTSRCLNEPGHPGRTQAGRRLVALLRQLQADDRLVEICNDHLGWSFWDEWTLLEKDRDEIFDKVLPNLHLTVEDRELVQWLLWSENNAGLAHAATEAIVAAPSGTTRDAWLREILARPHVEEDVLISAVKAYERADWSELASQLLGHPRMAVVLAVEAEWTERMAAPLPIRNSALELPEYAEYRAWVASILPAGPSARLCRYLSARDGQEETWRIGSLVVEESRMEVYDENGLTVPDVRAAVPLDPCGIPGFLVSFRCHLLSCAEDPDSTDFYKFLHSWESIPAPAIRWNVSCIGGFSPTWGTGTSSCLAGWLARTGQRDALHDHMDRLCDELQGPGGLVDFPKWSRQVALHGELEHAWTYALDSDRSLAVVKMMADPSNEGLSFHMRADALVRQIPERRQEFLEAAPMPVAEWNDGVEASREAKIAVLLSLLPLETWAGCEDGPPTGSVLPEPVSDGLYRSGLWTEEEEERWQAVRPTVALRDFCVLADLPALSLALPDERYLHGFECWRNYIASQRKALTVSGVAASLINDLAGFDVCHIARAYSLDEQGRARHWELVTQFCLLYAASTPYERLVFMLETQMVEFPSRAFQERTPAQQRAFADACVKEHPHTVPALLGMLFEADLRPFAREIVNSVPTGLDPWFDDLRPAWGGDALR